MQYKTGLMKVSIFCFDFSLSLTSYIEINTRFVQIGTAYTKMY